MGWLNHLGFQVQNLTQPIDRGARLLKHIGQVGEPGDGAKQQARQRGRGNHLAGGHPAGQHLKAAHTKNQ